MGYVGIGESVTEAIFDTGGSRSMVDVSTARKLGIPWRAGKNFGTFLGVGGVPTPYAGVSDGTIRL